MSPFQRQLRIGELTNQVELLQLYTVMQSKTALCRGKHPCRLKGWDISPFPRGNRHYQCYSTWGRRHYTSPAQTYCQTAPSHRWKTSQSCLSVKLQRCCF